jgi:hypothetical protein
VVENGRDQTRMLQKALFYLITELGDQRQQRPSCSQHAAHITTLHLLLGCRGAYRCDALALYAHNAAFVGVRVLFSFCHVSCC